MFFLGINSYRYIIYSQHNFVVVNNDTWNLFILVGSRILLVWNSLATEYSVWNNNIINGK